MLVLVGRSLRSFLFDQVTCVFETSGTPLKMYVADIRINVFGYISSNEPKSTIRQSQFFRAPSENIENIHTHTKHLLSLGAESCFPGVFNVSLVLEIVLRAFLSNEKFENTNKYTFLL